MRIAMNGADEMRIAAIQGLIAQVQSGIIGLSNTNSIQTNAKVIASKALELWERSELFELQRAYEDVETS